jgi:putative ABC transport system permease protein
VSLRNVAGLYLVRLRGRIGQELLAFAGIAVGVALLFAALVANSSLTGSFQRETQGIIGKASYEVVGRGGSTIAEADLSRIKALPGVRGAAAVIEAHGEIRGPRGKASVLLLGVAPQLAELGGSFGKGLSYSSLANVRVVAMPSPLADRVGVVLAQPAVLVLGGRQVLAPVAAKLQAADIGDAVNSPVVLAPLRYAQELMDEPGKVTRVLVRAERGHEAAVGAMLRKLAGDHADVHPADFDVDLFRQAAGPASQSTAMFSVLGAMVGFLFAFSAMLLTVPQRRRLISDLDLEGYRARTIVKVLLFDAVVLGLAASAIGIVLGDEVAQRLFAGTPDFLHYGFTVGGEQVVTLRSLVVAAAGGLFASCVAVLAPTLSTLLPPPRVRRGNRFARRAHELSTLAAGMLALATGIAIIVAAPSSSALGVAGLAALTVAMLLLLPTALRVVVAALDRMTSHVRSVVPFLVSFDLRDRTTLARSLAVASTGAVAVFASVALQGAHDDLIRGLDQTSRDVSSLGQVWARSPGDSNLLVTTPFARPDVRSSSGIERVTLFRGGFLDVGSRRTRVFGVPVNAGPMLSSGQYVEGDPAQAEPRLREGGWVVLSAAIAHDLGVGVGDRFLLPSPVPMQVRVAALSSNLGWPPGSIVMNADDYARAWGDSDVSAVLATLSPGTSPREGVHRLRTALGRGVTLDVESSEQFEHEQMAASRSSVARLSQIATLVLVSAILAMASAMAGLIWQRRAFLAGVKVEGYSALQMWKALVLEAAILIGTGCVLGAVFGLLGQGLLSRALTSVTGFPVVYSVAGVNALWTCAAVTLSAVAILAVLGQRAASVAPESGLGV